MSRFRRRRVYVNIRRDGSGCLRKHAVRRATSRKGKSMRKTPTRNRLAFRLRATGVAVAIAAVGGATLVGSPASASASAAPQGTSQFRGVNWADPRDNYADDYLHLSGLSTS